jgi:hypothetical protein
LRIDHVWLNAGRLEVFGDLCWNLTKHLFCQERRVTAVFEIRHKLNNVPRLVLFKLGRVKWCFICVQLLHTGEVGLANADNDNGEWEAGRHDDSINSLLHVHNSTISQNKQDGVLLIVLRHFLHFLLAVAHDILYYRREKSRSHQGRPLYRVLVNIQDALHAYHLRSENVAIKCKTMAYLLRLHDFTSETINRILLVGIVLFQDVANGHESVHILIWLAVRVQKVQRSSILDRTIGGSKIDSYLETDLASTEDVV